MEENGTSLTEYAKSRGISPQTVSQTFRRHKDKLAKVCFKSGRKTMLTSEGVRLMDEIRGTFPMTTNEEPETVEQLKERIQEMENQKEALTEQIKEKDNRIRDLEDMTMKQMELIAFKDQIIMQKDQQLLLTASQAKKGIIQRFREWVTGTDSRPLPDGENTENRT